MNDIEKNLVLRWIQNWNDAAPVIERDRRKRIREADTEAFIRMTAGLLPVYLQENGCRTTSGLVEQQRLFRSLAHD